MVGTQATELLTAVHRLFEASRKKQRLGSDLKGLQSARRRLWSSTPGQAGSGHRSESLSVSVDATDAIRSGTLVSSADAHLVGVGLLEAATAMP